VSWAEPSDNPGLLWLGQKPLNEQTLSICDEGHQVALVRMSVETMTYKGNFYVMSFGISAPDEIWRREWSHFLRFPHLVWWDC
jgi:hypothetical protein